MPGKGQSEKNSVRVCVFGVALKLGHCSTQPALRFYVRSRRCTHITRRVAPASAHPITISSSK
jgi:hypothetical protein